MEGVKSKEDKDKNDNDIEKEEISVPIETPSKHRKIHRKHIRHHHRHIKNSNNKTITDTGGDKNKTTKFKKSKKELNRRVSEISVPIETPRVNFIQNIDESSQKGDPKFIKRSIVKRRPPTVIANFQNHDN